MEPAQYAQPGQPDVPEEEARCEPHKIMRAAFELMRVLAIHKRPGCRGDEGPRGCAGTDGDDETVKVLIERQVCGEFTQFASSVQCEFWDVLARDTPDPLGRYCTAEPVWSPKWDATPPRDLAMHVKNLIAGREACQGPDVTLVARRTRSVSPRGGGGEEGIVVACTIFRGVDDTYVVTSVDKTDGRVVFVSDIETMLNRELKYSRSFERYLWESRESRESKDFGVLSSLCRKWASEKVKRTLSVGDFAPPDPDEADVIQELLKKTFPVRSSPDGMELKVVCIRGDFAFVVPVIGDNVYEGAYDVRWTLGCTSHVGGAVVWVGRDENGEVTRTNSIERPTGDRIAPRAPRVRTVQLGALYDTHQENNATIETWLKWLDDNVTRVTWLGDNVGAEHAEWMHGIEQTTNLGEWVDAYENKRAAWCYYDDILEKGVLFNFYALKVLNENGESEGWRVAEFSDYQALWDYAFHTNGGSLLHGPAGNELQRAASKRATTELCLQKETSFGAKSCGLCNSKGYYAHGNWAWFWSNKDTAVSAERADGRAALDRGAYVATLNIFPQMHWVLTGWDEETGYVPHHNDKYVGASVRLIYEKPGLSIEKKEAKKEAPPPPPGADMITFRKPFVGV
jgi:hypothetical protein